ncbi:IucA/IucC family C-terminal-domain containing protein [Ectobacillus ponti]|uniref:Aerobactin siderophore biosynthesis IucA/IucC-like C-terminal domain-containing protein n=1 Tax=Ectobacillus ponti TaxID=2961894 RepID=A0AA41X8L5_9BACI|nr:IucA/IucC family C-terminal-domain containing protein [Ectobacillus ponti]MCP8968704.1 hypothetical protein [Ectobacillus ponti]
MEALWNRYRICQTSDDTSVHLTGQQLFSGQVEMALEHIRQTFQAPDQRVAASLFIKRYCGYLAALEAMSRWNAEAVLSLSDMCFRCTETQVFAHCQAACVRHFTEGDRNEWREQVVQRLFSQHIAVMIDALSKATRLPCATMWSHVAFYMHVMYRTWLQEEMDEGVRARIRDDFQYLQSLPSQWFDGTCNPLCMSFCTVKHPCREEDVLLRKACCLNYKTSKGACYTCPRLTEEERLQKMKDSLRA